MHDRWETSIWINLQVYAKSNTKRSDISTLQSSGWSNIYFWLSMNSKISFFKKIKYKTTSLPPVERKYNE
jgi:hypothetical protein